MRLRWNRNEDENRAESYARFNRKGERTLYIGMEDGEDEYTTRQLIAHEYAHLMVIDYPGKDKNSAWCVAYRETYDLICGGH